MGLYEHSLTKVMEGYAEVLDRVLGLVRDTPSECFLADNGNCVSSSNDTSVNDIEFSPGSSQFILCFANKLILTTVSSCPTILLREFPRWCRFLFGTQLIIFVISDHVYFNIRSLAWLGAWCCGYARRQRISKSNNPGCSLAAGSS